MAGTKRTDKRGRILKDGESQLPNGTYRFRYTDLDGVRRDVYSSRLVPTDRTPAGKKNDLSLREKEAIIKKDLADGIRSTVSNKVTLNDLFSFFMENRTDLRPTTRENYRIMYRNHVADGIGRRNICDIRYSDIKSFYNKLITNKGLSVGSVEAVHKILAQLFDIALKDGYVRANMTDGAMAEISRRKDLERPKRIALTIQEQKAFLRHISENARFTYYLPLFVVFLGTGCRVGEISGLRWEDCDFDAGVISINHSIGVLGSGKDGKRTLYVSLPKTRRGVREIPMLSDVRDALLSEYSRQEREGFCKDEIDSFSGFVFFSQSGRVYTSITVNKIIERILRSYNEADNLSANAEEREPLIIRSFTAHTLRHTFCTRLCENETNLKVIQEVMGHANIQTTMNIYAEATRDLKKKSFHGLEGKILVY